MTNEHNNTAPASWASEYQEGPHYWIALSDGTVSHGSYEQHAQVFWTNMGVVRKEDVLSVQPFIPPVHPLAAPPAAAPAPAVPNVLKRGYGRLIQAAADLALQQFMPSDIVDDYPSKTISAAKVAKMMTQPRDRLRLLSIEVSEGAKQMIAATPSQTDDAPDPVLSALIGVPVSRKVWGEFKAWQSNKEAALREKEAKATP